MIEWLKMPFQMPEIEDEGRLIEAVVDQGDGTKVLITGKLEFREWIEDDEDPESGFRLPLFNIISDDASVWSFHEVYEWRFIKTGTIQ